MAKNVTIELDTRVLDALIRNLDGNVEEAVAKVAFAAEGRTKVNIQQMGAVDTGALMGSVYTAMKNNRQAGQDAMTLAQQLNPDAEITPLPVPKDNHTAHVGPSVEYAAEVHFGTGSMAGRPYLLQAVRDTERDLREALGEAVTDGK